MPHNAGEDILASDFKGTRYYVVAPSDFLTDIDTQEWLIYEDHVRSRSNTEPLDIFAPIHLPHGAVITSVKAYWYRNDAAASGACTLFRTTDIMATVNSDSSGGNHSVEDTTINYATIDNENYHYSLFAQLNPNDENTDVKLYRVVITYTVETPLP